MYIIIIVNKNSNSSNNIINAKMNIHINKNTNDMGNKSTLNGLLNG